uniref:Uncharacterized protein n=1 Tax=Schistosoma curassoni TaxID=6186 RepID=A0A183JCR2_9TREM
MRFKNQTYQLQIFEQIYDHLVQLQLIQNIHTVQNLIDLVLIEVDYFDSMKPQ